MKFFRAQIFWQRFVPFLYAADIAVDLVCMHGYFTVFRDLNSLNRNIVTIAKNSLTESLFLEGTVDVFVPFANQH